MNAEDVLDRIETGASLVSPTSSGGNEAIHKGNMSSELDAATVGGKTPGSLDRTSDSGIDRHLDFETFGLVTHHPFVTGSGGIAHDFSTVGGTANASLNGSASWVSGDDGTAISFDGTNSYLNLGNNDKLDLTIGFSFGGWVYHHGSADEQNFITKEDGYEIKIDPSSNELAFALFTDGGWEWNPTGATLPSSTWKHVYFVYDGSDGIFYIDGAEAGRAADPNGGPIGTNNNDVWMGARELNGGMSWFNGTMSDWRIYNRILSPSEITAIMNGNA